VTKPDKKPDALNNAPGLLMQRFALDLLVQCLVVSHGVRACGQ